VAGSTAVKLDYAWGDFGILNQIQKFSVGFCF
jgi:hypothetical protein